MKIFVLLGLVLFSSALKAQDVTAYGNAPSLDVKLYHAATDKQTDLENTVAIKKQKKKLGGFGGVSYTYEIEGEKSNIRLNADRAIFIIRRGNGLLAMDISMSIQLFKLEIRNGRRVAVEADYTSSLVGYGKTTDTRITLSTKQFKDDLTQLLPKLQLEKGEYAFLGVQNAEESADWRNSKRIAYAFSIE